MLTLPLPIVVCVPAETPATCADDHVGTCAVCGDAVRFRPYIPIDGSLVCLLCFIVNADEDTILVVEAS